MKRSKLLCTISCVILTGLLCACGNQKDSIEPAKQETELIPTNEITSSITNIGKDTAQIASDIATEKSNTAESTLTFDYSIGYNEFTINFNIPDGWLLDRENTTNAQLTAYDVSSGQQLIILGATEQVKGWFDNYHQTGDWVDDLWEIKFNNFSEMKTPYGKIEIAEGPSATNGFNYHLCLLNNDNTYWYIEERSSGNENTEEQEYEIKPIEKIINEMFTGKSVPAADNSSAEPYVEEHINMNFQGDEYDYFIEGPDWSKNTPVNILGFNLPDGFEKVHESEAFSGDMVWKRSYTLDKPSSVHGSLDRIVICTTSGAYLQDYNKTNQFIEGVQYRNQYEIISVEKEEVVDTIYGKLQLFYQVAKDADGTTKEIETAICYVNDEVITIDLLSQYNIPDELQGYTGELREYLLQMFTNPKDES